MKRILLLGAGRSSYSLIQYLVKLVDEKGWSLTVGDSSVSAVREKTGSAEHVAAIEFNVRDEAQREQEVKRADLVISLLPPSFHHLVAITCLKYGRNFLTASYVSPEIQALDKDARDKGILILKEMGLDPGIDHMSAMMEIDRIKRAGGKLTSFKSYTGGLIAPECDDNPWNYKVTWNPRNVVLAGQGTVKYLENNTYKFIPYHKLFRRTEVIEVAGYGRFEGYANRDSLKYIGIYGLEEIPSFIRGTLRRPGFCAAWDVLVQLGMTEDSYEIDRLSSQTYRQFTQSFLSDGGNDIRKELAEYVGLSESSKEISKIAWLGLLSDETISLERGTPAQVIQQLIEKKWVLGKEDKDMIVMQHQFEFVEGGIEKQVNSSLVVKGDNSLDTAMAKTVGLPLGIAAKLILEGRINLTGVHIPVSREIYEPVLEELAHFGIRFFNENKTG